MWVFIIMMKTFFYIKIVYFFIVTIILISVTSTFGVQFPDDGNRYAQDRYDKDRTPQSVQIGGNRKYNTFIH